MIVKEKIQEQANVEATKIYEVYKEVSMETPTGESVTVLQLERTCTKQQVEQNIANYKTQITSLTTSKETEEAILAELV